MESYKFARDQQAWQEKMYALNNGEALDNISFFLECILGDLIHEEDKDNQEETSKGDDKELKRKKKDKKRTSIMSLLSHIQSLALVFQKKKMMKNPRRGLGKIRRKIK